MNSIVVKESGHAAANPVFGALRFALDAVRSITWREFAYFLFIFLLFAGLNMAWLLETMLKGGKHATITFSLLLPMLALPVMLAAWAIADRSSGRLARPWRLTLGVLLGAAVVIALAPHVVDWLGLDLMPDRRVEEDPREIIPVWAYWTAGFLDISFITGLAVAVLEMFRRRLNAQRALEAARKEQAHLARELLESRLAVMQAQVEPHFLFDSLVDVQATYDRNADHGSDTMDRLITYLRVALPRLRESGSTVQAEVDLVAAYLAVVAARHDGRPAAHFVVAPACANARFFPMLLLPLVQRAVRAAAGTKAVPARVDLEVAREGASLAARLRIDAPGLCRDDAELARVRERLDGLYDGRSRLTCEEPQPGVSLFTLCVPH